MTSLEGVPQRCRSGAGLRIWVSAGARGCPSLAMANDAPNGTVILRRGSLAVAGLRAVRHPSQQTCHISQHRPRPASIANVGSLRRCPPHE